MGTQPYWRLGRDLNPLVLSDFTDNPNSTARRKWHSRWESNPYLPDKSGCSLAVELRGDQMGKWRDRTEALHAGNRSVGTPPQTAEAFAMDGTPSLLVEDNRSTSAHQKLGWPNGFAPIPAPSQGAMLLLHHDHH